MNDHRFEGDNTGFHPPFSSQKRHYLPNTHPFFEQKKYFSRQRQPFQHPKNRKTLEVASQCQAAKCSVPATSFAANRSEEK